MGDGVLLRGTDTPTDTPTLGGAGFVVQHAQSLEFPDHQWLDVDIVPEIYGFESNGNGGIEVRENPYASWTYFSLIVANSVRGHGNIHSQMSAIDVDTCAGGGNDVVLSEEWTRLIKTAAGLDTLTCAQQYP